MWSRFESVAEQLVDILLSMGKLEPLRVDRQLGVRILSLREVHVGKLTHLLEICKEALVVNTYSRTQAHIDLLTEYICLLHIFDLAYLSTKSQTISLDSLRASQVRKYAADPRSYAYSGSDVSETEILVYTFFHALEFSRISQK